MWSEMLTPGIPGVSAGLSPTLRLLDFFGLLVIVFLCKGCQLGRILLLNDGALLIELLYLRQPRDAIGDPVVDRLEAILQLCPKADYLYLCHARGLVTEAVYIFFIGSLHCVMLISSSDERACRFV